MSEHLAYTVRQVRGPPPSVEATPMRKSARSGCGGNYEWHQVKVPI
jgi:hypothetical protein